MEKTLFVLDANIESVDDSGLEEASASLALNESMSIVKFIFTTDSPNKNKKRVPKEEFDNIIRTGLFMPFKKALGETKDGHDGSVPIGVITHLKKEESCIKGLAGIWKREFDKEASYLKEQLASGIQPQISWELLYGESTMGEDGIEDLKDITVRAATVVGKPAYAGMTPILAVASEEIPTTSDSEEENKVNLEELQAKFAELEVKYSELDTTYQALKASTEEKDTELSTLKQTNQELLEFKSSVEAEKAKAEKLAAIKAKFVEAGIAKDETYFSEKQSELLAMEDSVLEFMLQEMRSFAVASKEDTASTKIPNLTSETRTDKSPKALGKALREHYQKK